MINGNITFAWWNTSLSPAAKSRENKDLIELVCSLLILLIEKNNIDFIALGETSEADFNIFKNIFHNEIFDIEGHFTKVGRTQFDTCFIYRKEKLEFLEFKDITLKKVDRNYKIAQQINLISKYSNNPFNVFISHWSSRMYEHEDAAIRDLFGMRLRLVIDEILNDNNQAYIILLGDYNDEPFNKSIAEHLMASRDRCLVERKFRLLYNPFWRLLGSHCANGDNIIRAGTYYHEQGLITQWRTFDQILFSSSFLKNGEFILNDSLTQILDIPEGMSLIVDKNSIFDHLPVISIIEKENII